MTNPTVITPAVVFRPAVLGWVVEIIVVYCWVVGRIVVAGLVGR